jgi:hypothetical protein
MPKIEYVVNKKEMVGEQEDDKPPPNLCVLPRYRTTRMVFGIIKNIVCDSEKQDFSSINSLYRKFGGTFGIQEFYRTE